VITAERRGRGESIGMRTEIDAAPIPPIDGPVIETRFSSIG